MAILCQFLGWKKNLSKQMNLEFQNELNSNPASAKPFGIHRICDAQCLRIEHVRDLGQNRQCRTRIDVLCVNDLPLIYSDPVTQ